MGEPIDVDTLEREAKENIAVCEAEVPSDVAVIINRHDRTTLALCAALRERDAEIAHADRAEALLYAAGFGLADVPLDVAVGDVLRALKERDAEIVRLRELVADVAHCGVESDLSPRYVGVQIDCETWADVQREAQP